jgi:Flp pilus assembly protein TadD
MLCAMLPVLPTLRAAFVYDDTTIIRDNLLLRGWGSLVHVWSSPYWSGDGGEALGLYRPVQQALLAVVWNVGHGSALLFHVYAILLAALTAVVVWHLLRRGTDGLPALVGAVWFASHPLHVEAIASVANTSELVVALSTIGLTFALVRRPSRVSHTRAGSATHLLLVAALAGVAIGAKESGLLALPLALLTAWGWKKSIEDRTSLREFIRENAREILAAIASVAAVLLARLAVLGAPVSTASIGAQGVSGTASERIVTMMSLWPRIARMLLLPSGLSPYYGPTIVPEHSGGLALLSISVFIGVAGLALVMARRGDARPLVALGWAALTYLPASNLVTPTGQLLSDRALFGATIGVALGIAWAVDSIPPFGRRVAAALMMLLVARNTLTGAHYAVAWTSHRTLWTRMIEEAPAEHLGYKLLGMDARARGDTTQAISLLERAFAMAPSDRQTRFELGQAQYATGRYRAAVATLSPLMQNADARGERDFVSLYLDAVGRSGGPAAVIRAATPLIHSATAPTADLFIGIAHEQMGDRVAAESAYVAGLRRSAGDSALLARYLALHPEQMDHHH